MIKKISLYALLLSCSLMMCACEKEIPEDEKEQLYLTGYIVDINDESDRSGMRIVIDVKKDFNESNHDSQVELKKLDFDKDNCYIKSAYSSAEAYSSFSSYKTYYGTVEQAFDKGYKFADSFAEVINGTKGQVLATDILNEYAGCYVAIVNENVNVKVPGDILYITDANTDVIATDEVSISPPNGNSDATNTVYIIFSMKNSK